MLASLWAAPVLALGVGGNFSAGSGESRWFRKDATRIDDFSSDYEYTTNIGGGLVIDAGKPGSGYFSRFNIGLDRYAMKTGYTQNIARFNFSTTFCFIIAQKDFFKFWLGPQAGLHYLFGSTGYDMYDHNPRTLFVFAAVPQFLYYFRTAKYNMAGADAGLVIGFDFDIRQYVTISVSLGLKYGASVGGTAFREGGLFRDNYLVYSHGFDRFVDVSVLCRFDDSRTRKQPEEEKS
ncbi:MAG: hypothetical protein A2176_09495 [Spirochaetes bacterium RBG_13_51_14]|nr:MAG: hypothetical protein A2176_09495 [Spirochaetes bacterium RBG_13_51_14]